MPADGPPPDARPASPFLILLLGGASCALGAEWLRFQWGPWLAVPPAVAGGIVTLTAVARAYRARRRWRRRRALADETARAVPAAPGDAALTDQEPALVRASRAQRPLAGGAGAGEKQGARPGTVAADAAPSSDRSERPPTGAASDAPDADREHVGAARAHADRDPRRPRRDR